MLNWKLFHNHLVEGADAKTDIEDSVATILWKTWTQSSTSLQEHAWPRRYASDFTLNNPECKTHDLVVSPYTATHIHCYN